MKLQGCNIDPDDKWRGSHKQPISRSSELASRAPLIFPETPKFLHFPVITFIHSCHLTSSEPLVTPDRVYAGAERSASSVFRGVPSYVTDLIKTHRSQHREARPFDPTINAGKK